MGPFEYLNSINYTKKDLMVGQEEENSYNAFMVNRGLSQFYETTLIANEMNIHPHIDNRMQYDFLRNIIRKKKRFTGWAKKEKIDKVDLVMEYYGYSREKSLQVLPLLSEDEISYIRNKLSKGGKSRKS